MKALKEKEEEEQRRRDEQFKKGNFARSTACQVEEETVGIFISGFLLQKGKMRREMLRRSKKKWRKNTGSEWRSLMKSRQSRRNGNVRSR